VPQLLPAQRFTVWKRLQTRDVAAFIEGLAVPLRPKVAQACAHVLREAGLGAVVDRFTGGDRPLNPASAWVRYTNGGRVLYARQAPVSITLQEPAEGVESEAAVDDNMFERLMAHAH